MWNATERARFESLRQREDEGTLPEAEQTELARMIEEIEGAEAAYLKPATEHLRAQRAALAADSAAVQDLLRREEALAQRLTQTLAEAKAERRAIEEELGRIVSQSGAPPA